MKKLVTGFAAVVATIVLIVHLVTFVPSVPITMRQILPLVPLVMIAFMSGLVALGKAAPARSAAGAAVSQVAERHTATGAFWDNRFKQLPQPARILLNVVVVYVVLNFFLFSHNLEGATPEKKNGQAYLSSHGTKIRDLTPYEYQRMQAYEVRGLSGHLMLFSFFPALMLLSAPAGRAAENGAR